MLLYNVTFLYASIQVRPRIIQSWFIKELVRFYLKYRMITSYNNFKIEFRFYPKKVIASFIDFISLKNY